MTRRNWIVLAAPASRLLPADPWKDKTGVNWNDDDVKKLMSKSPWSKEISVSTGPPAVGAMGGGRRGGGMGGGGAMGGGGGMGGDMGGGGASTGGGMQGGGGMGGAGGMGGGGGAPQIKALIRWESAAPMFEAVKAKRTPQAESHYIVTVTGLPMMGGRGMGGKRGDTKEGGASPEERQKMMLMRMKEATRLERKGKDPIPADNIMAGRTQRGMVIGFLFSRQGQEISLADKEVTFHSQLGPIELKAKFVLRDMVFQGKLEL